MAEISAKLVKELRDRTGLGMMECKKALQEADGDIETAIDNLRKSGQAKAAKKAGNIAADGAIIIAQEGNKALLLEVCLLYTSPSPRDLSTSRMPSSA